MKVNKEIRAPKVRLIDEKGQQVGVVSITEAVYLAEKAHLDLVEISPNSEPPVCKIIDFGKFRYQLTKKEKDQKKTQQQTKLKEIKFKLNIDQNDLQVKIKHAREFIEKGSKVRFTCMFRGREVAHPEIGTRLVERVQEDLKDVGAAESPPKLIGRNLIMVIAPLGKKK